MRCSPRAGFSLLLLLGLSVPFAAGQARSSVRRVHVLGGKGAVEIEVEGSEKLVPETRVLTGPDRLVVDFPNAIPVAQLRNQSVNRGEVKDVRIGLFQSNPPVTRLVLDLNSAQSFQVFPNGRTVIIKVTGAAPQPAPVNAGVDEFPAEKPQVAGLVNASYQPGAANSSIAPLPPMPPLQVSFRNGLLSIHSDKASLSELLFAVHQRTGAEVAIAAGAEQEQVVADLGPAPAPEVLANLLNGSRYNFLILSAPDNPQLLERIILTPRGASSSMPLMPIQQQNVPQPAAAEVDDEPQPQPVVENVPPDGPPQPQPGQVPPPGQPEHQQDAPQD